MNQISLLSPDENSRYFDLGDTTANDLGIAFLAEQVSESSAEHKGIQRVLLRMPADARTVRYRREIYNELRENETLSRELFKVFDSLRFSFNDRPINIGGSATIWELLQRFRSLEHYIHSVTQLRDLITGKEFRSEGMRRFAEFVHLLSDQSGYDELQEDIAALGEDITRIRSVTIGVNLTPDFYPRQAGIVSLNTTYFDQQTALKRFMAYHRKDQVSDRVLDPFTMEVHQDGVDWVDKHFYGVQTPVRASDSVLMNNLTSIIERMLPSLTGKLHKVLDKYVDFSGRVLADLADEMLFYLRFISLEQKLTAYGLPCCCPEESAADTALTDFYNVRLAIIAMQKQQGEKIVCNDIAFTKDSTVQILTGPNRGGKTILTQGIGLAFLLYQSGVFVPASSAKIRPCDGIYTHFPVEEERTVSLGRLGEEAERFREICRAATGESLLLFNESFATTSHTESLYIAEDVLKYLCCLGARTCFNTHMHELAEHCDRLSESEHAVCKAVSLVMENGEQNRYKITCRKPDGKSYAHVIAKQYGITFEQLSELL